MVNNQCYVCNNIVATETNVDVRNKYYNLIGRKLYSGTNLCYICSHLTKKLWSFRNICLNKDDDLLEHGCEEELNWSLLFRLTKDADNPHNLQISLLNHIIICPEDVCQSVESTHLRFDALHNDIIHELVNDVVGAGDNGVRELELEQFDSYSNYDQIAEYRDEDNQAKESNIGNIQKNDNTNFYTRNSTEPISDNISMIENCGADDVSVSSDDEQNNDENDDCDEELMECNAPKTEEELLLEEIVRRHENKHFTKIQLSFEEQKSGIDVLRKSKKYIEAEFKCHNCGLGFLYKDSYRTHMVRHEESNGQYTCTVCTLRFATPNAHRMHVTLHAVKYICSVCDSVLSSSNRKRHKQECWKEAIEPVSCHLCGKIFNDNSGLQQHLKRFHSMKNKKHNYTCNICGKKYTYQTGLRTHLIVHTDRVFKCQQCDRTYTNPNTLAQHKKTHTNTQTQKFYCTMCGTFYASKKLLRKHEKYSSAHQTFSYECPACTRTYATQKSLQIHINTIHSALKPYQCGLCPARYSTKKSLNHHCKIHTDYVRGKKFICDMCGKCYRGKSKLTRHVREVCERNKSENMYHIFSEDLVTI